ncbi:MAG: hypothetical protein ACK5Z5_08000 [Neisseriaceae bacterium]
METPTSISSSPATHRRALTETSPLIESKDKEKSIRTSNTYQTIEHKSAYFQSYQVTQAVERVKEYVLNTIFPQNRTESEEIILSEEQEKSSTESDESILSKDKERAKDKKNMELESFAYDIEPSKSRNIITDIINHLLDKEGASLKPSLAQLSKELNIIKDNPNEKEELLRYILSIQDMENESYDEQSIGYHNVTIEQNKKEYNKSRLALSNLQDSIINFINSEIDSNDIPNFANELLTHIESEYGLSKLFDQFTKYAEDFDENLKELKKTSSLLYEFKMWIRATLLEQGKATSLIINRDTRPQIQIRMQQLKNLKYTQRLIFDLFTNCTVGSIGSNHDQAKSYFAKLISEAINQSRSRINLKSIIKTFKEQIQAQFKNLHFNKYIRLEDGSNKINDLYLKLSEITRIVKSMDSNDISELKNWINSGLLYHKPIKRNDIDTIATFFENRILDMIFTECKQKNIKLTISEIITLQQQKLWRGGTLKENDTVQKLSRLFGDPQFSNKLKKLFNTMKLIIQSEQLFSNTGEYGNWRTTNHTNQIEREKQNIDKVFYSELISNAEVMESIRNICIRTGSVGFLLKSFVSVQTDSVDSVLRQVEDMTTKDYFGAGSRALNVVSAVLNNRQDLINIQGSAQQHTSSLIQIPKESKSQTLEKTIQIFLENIDEEDQSDNLSKLVDELQLLKSMILLKTKEENAEEQEIIGITESQLKTILYNISHTMDNELKQFLYLSARDIVANFKALYYKYLSLDYSRDLQIKNVNVNYLGDKYAFRDINGDIWWFTTVEEHIHIYKLNHGHIIFRNIFSDSGFYILRDNTDGTFSQIYLFYTLEYNLDENKTYLFDNGEFYLKLDNNKYLDRLGNIYKYNSSSLTRVEDRSSYDYEQLSTSYSEEEEEEEEVCLQEQRIQEFDKPEEKKFEDAKLVINTPDLESEELATGQQTDITNTTTTTTTKHEEQ